MDILFTMIFVIVHLFQKHIAVGFSYKLGKSLSILKAFNLGQVSEKDFWKNQNQYILPWKNSKKICGFDFGSSYGMQERNLYLFAVLLSFFYERQTGRGVSFF